LGAIKDIFIRPRRSKNILKYRFVWFDKVRNITKLGKQLDAIYIGEKILFVHVPKFSIHCKIVDKEKIRGSKPQERQLHGQGEERRREKVSYAQKANKGKK